MKKNKAKILSAKWLAGTLLVPVAGFAALAKNFEGLTNLTGLGAWTGSARSLPGSLPARALRAEPGAAIASAEIAKSLEKNLAPDYFAGLVEDRGLQGSGLEGNSFSGPV